MGRNKAGRMLTAGELIERQLVVAKHEDKPRIRCARIVWVGESSVGLVWDGSFKSQRKLVLATKSSDGLLLDRSGKCIFVWEYMNLDGTAFKLVEPKP